MNKTPINNGLAQSDIDFAGFKPFNADLSDYAGRNLNWNSDDGTLDAASGPGMFVSVKDAPFNALGKGVTDDTAAINSAMGAVFVAGGGTVFFPKGDYLCNGALHPGVYNSILEIPFNPATSPVSITLLGEDMPAWYVTQPFNNAFASTIRSTVTGTGTAPRLHVSSQPGRRHRQTEARIPPRVARHKYWITACWAAATGNVPVRMPINVVTLRGNGYVAFQWDVPDAPDIDHFSLFASLDPQDDSPDQVAEFHGTSGTYYPTETAVCRATSASLLKTPAPRTGGSR